jgi:hypothetical protein
VALLKIVVDRTRLVGDVCKADDVAAMRQDEGIQCGRFHLDSSDAGRLRLRHRIRRLTKGGIGCPGGTTVDGDRQVGEGAGEKRQRPRVKVCVVRRRQIAVAALIVVLRQPWRRKLDGTLIS